MELMPTEGEIALVTGAAGGIGRAVVDALTARGWQTLGMDLAGADLDCDITDPHAVEEAIRHIEEKNGPITRLAHTAGALRTGSLVDSDVQDLHDMIAVNTFGTAHLLHSVGQRMKKRGRGSIVAVASNAAIIPRVDLGAYGASKAAAAMLVRSAGLELAPHGVRCNVVHPGSTSTPMLWASWPNPDDPDALHTTIEGDVTRYRTGIPLGRVARPEDIASCVAFLLSDEARHVTMSSLVVDGGASL
ncbi:2,3-dihydro-2,3-dihydroxybenzoate dehydrogenase [Austwickia chelonae]|uniref:Putative 2,3-dihydro-2,3-dihydroxybenzoate dehydrogenase n=1 Tax=Austwickia chelonae NBRC 105200 TaxID=1184607 RepID=K6WC70_9MICO|nr:2,3-dihydro-2,3-dihydroxybenzoate dehydrogenase [Austwickia chelonae]GAB79447.1 putative 2,3-dihydro-2,3-dihydroxybenzoate dehydrogenase [Austwickia chelonae NBRC 105200]SEW36722.1 2,3-dihydro-2,3-dihydroxybenzoate dehydrogenase [Austwickia chelonae]